MTVVASTTLPWPSRTRGEGPAGGPARRGESARVGSPCPAPVWYLCAFSKHLFCNWLFYFFYILPSIDITVQSADTCRHESKLDRPQTIWWIVWLKRITSEKFKASPFKYNPWLSLRFSRQRCSVTDAIYSICPTGINFFTFRAHCVICLQTSV